jgi:capsid protein
MDRQATWIERAIDRTVGTFSPQAQLRRVRARVATAELVRHYEAASSGRRTQNWRRFNGDANAANNYHFSLHRIRDLSRDLVRNTAHMGAALRTIANHTVGWGIVAKPMPSNKRILSAWKAWAESTACDADGRDDLYGLQKLLIRGVAESGEMLVRRRFGCCRTGCRSRCSCRSSSPITSTRSRRWRPPERRDSSCRASSSTRSATASRTGCTRNIQARR